MSVVRRLTPQERLATIDKKWQGKIVVCIASGPSLTKEQLERVRVARENDAVRVIVVNENYLVAPWADVLYFADFRWWKWHTDGVERSWAWAKFNAQEVRKAFAGFKGQKVTIKHNPMAEDPEVLVLENDGPEGLSEKPTGIRTGSNSGYQALNIAVHSGGDPILLLGYDMRFQGNKSHAHSGHAIKMHESSYKGYAQRFTTMRRPLEQRGIKVINCSPGSAIKSFPIGELDACLQPAETPAVVQAPGV